MRRYITVNYNPELPQLKMQAVLQTNDEVLAARPNISVTGIVTLEGIPLPAGTVSFDGASAFATDAGGTYSGTVPYYYGGNAQMAVYTEPRYTVTPPYRGYYALTADQIAQDYAIDINYLILSGRVTDSGTGMVADVNNGTTTWQSAANGSYGYYVPYGWSGTTTAYNGSGTFTPAEYVYNAIGVDYPNQDFAFTSTIVPPSPVTISGAVTLDTILTEGIAVEFSGVGTFPTQIVDLAIIYIGTVPYNYSGTATLPGYTPYPLAYDVVPPSRVYTNQTTNLTNENYDISSLIYEISGTVGFDGTLFGIPITNGTDTWYSDAVTGSYGFWVLGGWSGTVWSPQYITDPDARVYTNVTTDAYEEHYQMTQPFLMIADNYFNWNTWSYEIPDRWFIYARNPADFTYSVYATNAGTDQDISIANTGSYYHVIGVNADSSPATVQTPDTYASPPLPPIIVLEGSVFNGTDGSGIVTNLYLDGYGTVATDGVGYWSQGMPAPYTGYVAVADPGFDGTFDPSYRSYVGEMLPQANQDFAFWPTAGPAPTDCQIPTGYQTIGDLPTPNQVSRSVNDPVNNLLWYVDDSYDYVYYVDAVAGTFQGSVTLTNSFGQSAIVYDPTNDNVVVMDWSGSIHVIDPVTKASTRVPGINMPDPGFHMLAVNDVGTVYATDNRNVTFGSVYAIDVASASLIRSTKLGVATDSICWASNINKLVINSGGAGQPAFYIFDPATDTFSASTLLNPLISFRYENFYIPQTGHMLESFSGGQPSAVIDISLGTAATQITTIQPTRVSNADIDTCTNHLFVTNGNYAMWEYTLDGSYTLVNLFDRGGAGINPNSCSHNRQSNLVYVADYGDGTIYTYMATGQSGTVGGLAWTVDQGVNPDTTGGYAAAQGGLGWFSGSAVGEDSTPFQSYSPNLTAALSNLDAPYPAQMTTVYTGSINDSGNLDAPSYFYIYQNLNGASTSVTVTGTVTGTNTTFSGTLVSAGTVTTGYNTFEVDTQFYCGGNFTVSPCNTYVAVTGSISITPLTPP